MTEGTHTTTFPPLSLCCYICSRTGETELHKKCDAPDDCKCLCHKIEARISLLTKHLEDMTEPTISYVPQVIEELKELLK